MQRSSDSIGAIAGALAKAQVELLNPEKSITATIPAPESREGERIFRYAPLSSGLDIVRKNLGRYEIATVQTTSIDNEAGLIRLTTILAHSSGEWISSEFPVCPISETAAPHRLGAALTYARRYALFTLVGIAGDDDTDAPDLSIPRGAGQPNSQPTAELRGKSGETATSKPTTHTPRRGVSPAPFPLLAPDRSAALRSQLESKLEGLRSSHELTAWATHALATKNSLLQEDAYAVEQAFAQRMNSLLPSENSSDSQRAPAEPGLSIPTIQSDSSLPRLAPIPKTPRRRDKRHLRFVSTQPCLVCGRTPSDPHHLRFAEPRALGRKVSDEFTVPLCRAHHRSLHDCGDERTWWSDLQVEPLTIAQQLWSETR